MTGQSALLYTPQGANEGSDRLVGMQVANAGFLKAYLAHAQLGPAYIHTLDGDHFEGFQKRFPSHRELVHIPPHDISGLSAPGGLFLPGPALGERAWLRRAKGRTGFSLTGLTHAMASRRALDEVRAMLTAPMAPWDALICTSISIRDLVEKVWQDHSDELADILGVESAFHPHLPVIPLGVSCDDLDDPDKMHRRSAVRKKHDIPEGAFTVLYLGRLSHHTKAHPSPLYIALQRLSDSVKKPVTLVQAGWFYNEAVEAQFHQAAALLAPDVHVVSVDGRGEEARRDVLAAADVFVSLADNIQESFGLTPIEAMAAGMPAVVSDWDGYRDSVVDGETGFLIPTLLPPGGAGGDLAWRLATGIDDYDVHVGLVAQYAAVDIERCVSALKQLADDADLCARLGAAGQKRARTVYDWPVIVSRYEHLWEELAEIRQAAPVEEGQVVSVYADPFDRFAGFAGGSLKPGDRIEAVPGAERLLRHHAANALAALDPALIAQGRDVLEQLRRDGPLNLPSEMSRARIEEGRHIFRVIAWLVKMGMVKRTRAPV